MRYLPLLLILALFTGCATVLTPNEDYIAIGPQDLSVQVQDYKNMPVYLQRDQIKKPWASIGLLRVKNLPNNQEVLKKELNRMKKYAAAKGAQAIIVAQYFDEDNQSAYPVTLAAYLVKYLEDVSEADRKKIEEFSQQAAMQNDGAK